MIETVRDLFRGARRDGRPSSCGAPDACLDEIIDNLAQIVSPRILTMRGYRKRLREPVRQAVSYFRRASDALPGPLALAHERWQTDPALAACFGSPERLDAFIHGDPALRRFADRARNGSAFFLLTMTRCEPRAGGGGPACEAGGKSAPQGAWGFVNHRALAVTASLAETRRSLVRAGLERLAAMAAAQIIETHKKIEEQERVRAALKHELKLLRLEGRGLGKAFVDQEDLRRRLDKGERAMRELVSDLAQLRSEFVELDDYLEFAAHVFEAPSECIAFRSVPLAAGSADTGSASDRLAELVEIRLPDKTRVAILAECAAADILAGRA